jgi:hypothetical protein
MLHTLFNRNNSNDTAAETTGGGGGGGRGGDRASDRASGNRSSRLAMRSCHDQSLTAIQWLVYEMPKLRKEHRPLLFILEPGELVWMPDHWLHLTVNIDDALYVYGGACTPSPEHETYRTGRDRVKGGARRVCERLGRFCDGYCHVFCEQCEGRETTGCD